ncbi:MAG: AAA family ATPase, partial [Thermoleophilia bacterium]|nr:AAA family ATPase [Thermoleophilia bacterium]
MGVKPVVQSPATRVLLVARRDPQDPIGASLKRAGFAVLQADNGVTATRLLEHDRPDVLVIHENALGGRDLESLSAAASRYDVPVVVLSRSTDSRADDSGDSLVERIRALLGGSAPGHAGAGKNETERLTVGPLVVDLDEHTVELEAVPLSLTAKEFELLCHFARRPGRVWSRQQLIDLIWGCDFVEPRVVTVHIANLRRKLEQAAGHAVAGTRGAAPSGTIRIEAVRSVGYRLVCQADRAVERPAGVSTAWAVDHPVGPLSASDSRHKSGRLPFVGRERELAVLRAAVDAAMNGEVRGAAIVGDPGIGKTRLAEETAAYARDAGARVNWGRCRDASAKPVYEPWVEIVEQWKRENPTGELARIFAPEPPGDVRSADEGESARLRVFDRLVDAVRHKADEGPLCLVIDDLHWADPSTLMALQYVISHVRDTSLILLLTYRSGEPAQSPLLTEVINELVRGDLGAVLPLRSLSESEVGLFVELTGLDRKEVAPEADPGTGAGPGANMSGVAHGGTTPAADVYRVTEGNPFFMTQLVRLRLLESESPEPRPGGPVLSREEGVRHVVLRRLSRLSAPCRETLDVASVIGREFTQPVLADATDLTPALLLERLAEAIDTHILLTREDAPGGYRFAHSIFQDVLRAELSPQRRATLHAKVGAALERLYGDELDAHAADLAYHFSEAVPAGFASQAVAYCLRAGRVAVAHFAWNEALSQLRRAADLLEILPVGAPERAPIFASSVWEELGDVHDVMVETDCALAAYRQAARRVPPGERLWQARLQEKVAMMHMRRRRFDQSMACLTEVDELLGSPAEDADTSWWDTWIRVQTIRGWLCFYEERLQELYGLLDQAARTMGSHGSPRERARFLRLRIIASWTQQRGVSTTETLALVQECAENFRAAGSPGDLLYAERILANAYLWSPEKSEEAYDQLILFYHLAKRHHSVWHGLPALWYLEIWHRRRGETETVRKYAQETLSLMTDPPGVWTEFGGEAKGHLSWVAWRAGDLHQARALSTDG